MSGTENARRERAIAARAAAGVITVRSRMPASVSGCSASAICFADAALTTTGMRTPSAGPAGAMSAHTPRVGTPSSASVRSASARMRSYDPMCTSTWRCSLAVPQTTTDAALPRRDCSASSRSGSDAGHIPNETTLLPLPGVRHMRPRWTTSTMRLATGVSSMPTRVRTEFPPFFSVRDSASGSTVLLRDRAQLHSPALAPPRLLA